eukprot:1180518-Rhodomonas_salina.1
MCTPEEQQRSSVALFCCLKWLFGHGIGKERRSVARKRRGDGADAAAAAASAINKLEMKDDYLEQALFLMSSWYSSESVSNSDEDLDVLLANKRLIGAKQLPRDSIVKRWITDPFWFDDPEFKSNLLLSHCTFLELVKLLAPDVQDSVNQLTGHVYATKEFKVAVALYHLGHGGTCCSTANCCSIGVATVKRYTKLVVGAIIKHAKPLYMPGTPDARHGRNLKETDTDQTSHRF